MTQRQLNLLNLIIKLTAEYGSASQQDIYCCMSYEANGKNGYKWNDNPKCHDHCPTIWKDINAINSDNDSEYIIISPSPFVYKIAQTKEEVEKFIFETYHKPALLKLARESKMRKKLAKNGYGELAFDESGECKFWETLKQELKEEISHEEE